MAKITIGGKDRVLKLGSYGMGIIEEDLNCSFLMDAGKLLSRLQVRVLVSLLWGGLAHAEQSLQKVTVSNWVDQELEKDAGAELSKALMQMIEECPLFRGVQKDKEEEKIVEKKTSGKKLKLSA